MMETAELKQLLRRWAVGQRKMEYAPDANIVTGDYKIDLGLHHFEQDSGIEIKMNLVNNLRVISGYEIVDEKKFTWFLLRWA